jgi:hypothetical protein
VDPVPDPLLLRKSGSAGYRTRDLWVSSQEVCPLDHRGDEDIVLVEKPRKKLPLGGKEGNVTLLLRLILRKWVGTKGIM